MTDESAAHSGPPGNPGWLSRAAHMVGRLEARERHAAAETFVHSGPWLARTGYLPTVARYWLLPPSRRLPGLHRVRALGLVGHWLSPFDQRVRLRSSADAIQLSDDGNRLRALYLGGEERRSVKLVAVARRPDMRPDQEVLLRGRVAALGTIRVPRVFASRIEDGIVTTEEELILGRRLMVRYDLAFIRDVLVPRLLATYRAAGLVYAPISRHVPADFAERLPPGPFRDAVSRLVLLAPDAAISFCHGDISPSNIVVSGTDPVIVDWEYAGPGIAALDLLALALRYPHNRRLFSVVETAVTSHLAERGARFRDLLLLALANRMVRQPAWSGKAPDWMLRKALAV